VLHRQEDNLADLKEGTLDSLKEVGNLMKVDNLDDYFEEDNPLQVEDHRLVNLACLGD
jgi:hypothetical protein